MTQRDTYGCKVDRIADEYELTNLNDRLLRRRENEDASLRDLDAYINRRITEVALQRAGINPIGGDPQTYHQHIRRGDGIESREARQELRREGVDVDALEDDYVSYQTVRKHLNECLNHDTSKPDYEPSPSEDRQRLAELKGRCENVIERTLRRLRKHDAIQIGPPKAVVQLQVRCGDCGRTHTVSQLLRERECACSNTTVNADTLPPTSDAEAAENTPK